MIIVRIQLDRALNIPGRKQSDTIEPAEPSWDGWEFELDRKSGQLLMRAPAGYFRDVTPTDSLRSECEATGTPLDAARMVLAVPCESARLLLLDDGAEAIRGPSAKLAKQRARASGQGSAEEAARLKSKREALAKARAAKAAKASAPKPAEDSGRAARTEPKRPPWATRDPVPPPSPPEEEFDE